MIAQRFRTFLRTNPVTGPLVTWGWRHYLTALAESRPDDCADIPKVPGAGEVFPGENGDPPYQRMHNGLKIALDGYYSNLFTEIIRVLRGHHEPQEERVFHRILDDMPDDLCMVELGGYWAYYSMWARAAKPRARTLIVEPVDKHLALGRANLALNGMTAEFVRAYVGETSLPPHAATLEGERVADLERVSVDDLLARHRVPFAHVIHGDVQGAELDLLRGAERTIAEGRVGYFFLATHGDGLHAVCRQHLTARGFVVVADHTRAESYTTDGLIVARAPNFPGPDRIPISRNTRRASPAVLAAYVLRRLTGRARAGARA